MHDLMEGILSTDDDNPTAPEAWNDVCSHLLEFAMEEVVFEQFEERLKNHRAAVRKMDERSMWEMAACEHDRNLHPRNPINARGETVFDLSAAKPLLHQDIVDGMHKTMNSTELRATRLEHQPPLLSVSDRQFKEIVKQMDRRKRHFNCRDDKKARTGCRNHIGDPQPGPQAHPPNQPPEAGLQSQLALSSTHSTVFSLTSHATVQSLFAVAGMKLRFHRIVVCALPHHSSFEPSDGCCVFLAMRISFEHMRMVRNVSFPDAGP